MTKFLRTCFAVVCLLLSTTVFATYTFTGNGSWSDPANWQGGVVPTFSATDVVVIQGTCTLMIGSGIEHRGSLTVASSGTLTLQSTSRPTAFMNWFDATITVNGVLNSHATIYDNGALVVNGTLNTYDTLQSWLGPTLKSGSIFHNTSSGFFFAHNVTIEPGATFINDGKITGNAILNGTGTLTNSGVVAPGNSPGSISLSGDYQATTTALHDFEVAGTGNGYYDVLNVAGSATLNGTLKISLLNNFTPSVANPDLPIITAGSLSGTFSSVIKPLQYAVVYTGTSVVLRVIAALPVRFTSVDVKSEGDKARLNWSVLSQSNVSHYEVERSGNGTVYQNIGEAAASQQSQYTFLDAPPTGKCFYRVKCVDRDGRTSYSAVVAYSGRKGTVPLLVYPSPAHAAVTVQHPNAGRGSRLLLSNMDGKLVQAVWLAEGMQQTALNVKSLPAGTYVVQYMRGNDPVQRTTFVKQ